jgi:hypothetical protein
LPPERPLRNPQLPGAIGIEPAQADVFHQGVAYGVCPMLGVEHRDLVLVARQAIPRLDLYNLDRKLVALDTQGNGRAEDSLGSLGSVERDGKRPVL